MRIPTRPEGQSSDARAVQLPRQQSVAADAVRAACDRAGFGRRGTASCSATRVTTRHACSPTTTSGAILVRWSVLATRFNSIATVVFVGRRRRWLRARAAPRRWRARAPGAQCGHHRSSSRHRAIIACWIYSWWARRRDHARRMTVERRTHARSSPARRSTHRPHVVPAGHPTSTALTKHCPAAEIHMAVRVTPAVVAPEDPRVPGQGAAPEVRRAGADRHRGDCRAEDAIAAIPKVQKQSGTEVVVVKAQIHAGGRGKGGGVKVAKTRADAEAAVKQDLRHAAGHAADRPRGQEGPAPARRAGPRDRARVLPRHAARPRDRPRHGDGVDRGRHGHRGGRREAPGEDPQASAIDPAIGWQDYQARELAQQLGLDGKRRRASSPSSCAR